jgi:hypothetical protein
LCYLVSNLLEHLCNQPGQARLVTGAASRAILAVKVFIEQQAIAPMWIGWHHFITAEDGAPPVLIAPVDPDESL